MIGGLTGVSGKMSFSSALVPTPQYVVSMSLGAGSSQDKSMEVWLGDETELLESPIGVAPTIAVGVWETSGSSNMVVIPEENL